MNPQQAAELCAMQHVTCSGGSVVKDGLTAAAWQVQGILNCSMCVQLRQLQARLSLELGCLHSFSCSRRAALPVVLLLGPFTEASFPPCREGAAGHVGSR